MVSRLAPHNTTNMSLTYLHAYLLVLFLFHVPVTIGLKCKAREREALLSLKRGFVNHYGRLSSWGSGENQQECCEWEGIVCSNTTGHVVNLNLTTEFWADTWTPLEGMINSSLAELRHLNHLDLSGNSFHVDIPKFIGSLTHLKYLNLSFAFQGRRVPSELGNLSRLQYLDLQTNFLVGDFPAHLASLSRLIYLDLSYNAFGGVIPHQLGNLSHLQYLSIGGFIHTPMARSNLEWLSSLSSSSLRTLKLFHVDLSSANYWLQLVTNLPHLRYLELSNSSLPGPDIVQKLYISEMNVSRFLTHIDLSRNYNLTSSIFAWLGNYKSSLQVLQLSGNLIREIPVSLWDICGLRELYLYMNKLRGQLHPFIPAYSHCAKNSLEILDLRYNQITGPMPHSLWDMCNLQDLDLSYNKFSEQFYQFVPTYPHCTQKSLAILTLTSNQITGTMPDLSQLSSLRELWLGSNMINGTLTKSIGKLQKLEAFDVSENSLQGLVTETLFSNLSILKSLDLSSNKLVLNFSDDWVPPFQLETISLTSCMVGPKFPKWLRTQKNYSELDMSSNEISGTIPQWFWNLPPMLQYLNLSNNHIRGKIPEVAVEFYNPPEISLSSNFFHGSIPSFFSQAGSLILSHNTFANLSSFLCSNKAKNMYHLEILNNQLTEELPYCSMNLSSLVSLDLSNNHLFGQIPASIGFLVNIRALHLANNSFTGEIPASLSNCKELRDIDLGNNKLSGPIPMWIGQNLDKLLIIILRSNQLNGTLPQSLCFLSRIRILDLSMNNMHGSIPRCLNNLTAMSVLTNQTKRMTYSYNGTNRWGLTFLTDYFDDIAWITWKGKVLEYSSTLGLLTAIDLSSNSLVGEIPREIMGLLGLKSLNLSRNKLGGKIPFNIGQLKLLDSLDLSWNLLFGRIPSSLSEIDGLGVLQLSYNNLSGKIPPGNHLQTFDASFFMGNPKLCGAPLPTICPNEEIHDKNHESNLDDNQVIDHGFQISMAIGFIVGFWGVCFSLIFIKSWRYAYFKFFNNIQDWVYVHATVRCKKVQRNFEGIKMAVFRAE